ncbi:transaldolase [Candidatus Woesebacteria bacterium]|nr:transaldolase [Candidatus Woesebacteria bacterium]
MNQPHIFLDSGDPEETKQAKQLLGFLDGQTTNPSLVAKNPDVREYLAKGKKMTETELLAMYKEIVQAIRKEIDGSISIETYADWTTTAEEMLKQAQEMNTWIENAHIKFPTIPEGLKAANMFVQQGGQVNMTLVFDQEQAAAVYSATLNSQKTHFVSPFVGRWDDRGYQGLDLIENIVKMYVGFNEQLSKTTSHVKVLSASIRNLHHFYASIILGADILTVPLKVLKQWVEEGKKIPEPSYQTRMTGLQSLDYKEIAFNNDYQSYAVGKVDGSLLDEGLVKFSQDWKKLIQ